MGIRLSWDDIWMDLAKSVSHRSTCKIPGRNVGCVIVPEDNSGVLAIGYNGGASGDDNSCDYDGSEKLVAGGSRCTCVHAEMNALTKMNTNDPRRKKMYLTLSPCEVCYKLIKNAGIDTVIFQKVSRPDPIQKLKSLGVAVKMYVDGGELIVI